jgi:hypothetical protein
MVVACAGLGIAPSGASADTFQAIPGPIEVTSVVINYDITDEDGEVGDSAPNTDVSFKPEFPTSAKTYSVTATITGQAFISDWSYVKLCLFDTTVNDDYLPDPVPEESFVDTLVYGGTPEFGCGNAASDLANVGSDAMEIVWSRVDGSNEGGSFALTAYGSGSNYVLVTSVFTAVGPAAEDDFDNSLTANVEFKFQVSNAMNAGTAWRALVVAQYDATLDQIAADGDVPGIGAGVSATTSVDFYAAMIDDSGDPFVDPSGTDAPNTEFGLIAEGGASTVNAIVPGRWVSNGPADLSLEGANFTVTPDDLAADTLDLVTDSPETGEVQLTCASEDTATPAAINVGVGGPTPLGMSFGVTGELPVNSDFKSYNQESTLSCTLAYGGGAKYAFTSYSATVVVTIGETTP